MRFSSNISQITTLVYYRKSYLFIIIPNAYEKLTKITLGTCYLESVQTLLMKPIIGSHIWSLFAPIYMTRGICGHYCATLHEIHLKNSYMVIICAKSYQKLTKAKLGLIEVGLNIAQNHLFSQ